MEKNHPVSELMAETIQKIKEAVDANTVVGQPITAGEVTIIPVSRISLGFGTGGSEFGGKAPKNLGENPFGGGGGAGSSSSACCQSPITKEGGGGVSGQRMLGSTTSVPSVVLCAVLCGVFCTVDAAACVAGVAGVTGMAAVGASSFCR